MAGWEEDSDMFDEEETDLGEDPSPQPMTAPQTREHGRHVPAPLGGKRRIRVKPMPERMRQKKPDLVSCLLTLQNGRQVLYVR